MLNILDTSSAEEDRVLSLQRVMVDLALAPKSTLSLESIASLCEEDRIAFQQSMERLQVYRELVRQDLLDPIETFCPIAKRLLEREGAWEACAKAFLSSRTVSSPHYRDVAAAFLGWLASSRWGQDRWPFLLALVHFEVLEVMVVRYPDGTAMPGLHPTPGPMDRIVLDATAQVISYEYAVHRCTEDEPYPICTATHLLAYRNPMGFFQLMELTPATAALLIQAQSASIASVVTALELFDLQGTLDLLANLHARGILQGFHPFPK